MKIRKSEFIPQVCTCCGQTTEYAIRIDRGSAHIVLAIAAAVQRLNRNRIHLRDDMEVDSTEKFGGYNGMIRSGFMTSKMLDNVLRPKYFGLVAQVDGGGKGEYLLTPKGAHFLRGASIERMAIVEKRTHSKKRYEESAGTISLPELLKKDGPYWDVDMYSGGLVGAVAGAFESVPLFEI